LAQAVEDGKELSPFIPIGQQIPGLTQAASPGSGGYRSPSIAGSCECIQRCINDIEGLPAIWDALTLMLGRDWGKIERDRARAVANCLKGVQLSYRNCRK
jgi:hypothetical protein